MKQWFSDLWNLSRIFDKYIPRLKTLEEDVARLEQKLDDLRQAELNLEKEVKRLKSPPPSSTPDQPAEKAETIKKESRITKVNRYYDPQMGVEYLDFEVNGDKASPEDDTVRE